MKFTHILGIFLYAMVTLACIVVLMVALRYSPRTFTISYTSPSQFVFFTMIQITYFIPPTTLLIAPFVRNITFFRLSLLLNLATLPIITFFTFISLLD